jgi:hypothetical protein
VVLVGQGAWVSDDVGSQKPLHTGVGLVARFTPPVVGVGVEVSGLLPDLSLSPNFSLVGFFSLGTFL